jgi:hypothetical protein
MNTEERKQYIYDTMKMALENDNDLMVEVVESMDNYDGFLNEYRLYDMSEIDDILYGKLPSEVIHMLAPDFEETCDYFYFNGNGWLASCDDKVEFYLEYNTIEEILDNYIEKYYHYDLSSRYDNFNELAELLDGYTDDDTEEETDDEFKERVDDLYAEL